MSPLKKTRIISIINPLIHIIFHITPSCSLIIPPQIKSEDEGEEEEKSVAVQCSSIPLLANMTDVVFWKRKLMREECETGFHEERGMEEEWWRKEMK
jgi:hypothetical protein